MKFKNSLFILSFFLFLLNYGCKKDEKTDENAARMQTFIADISVYAKGLNPDFIIIPQNGIELAFNFTDPSEGINSLYINAIDGFGVEELFYDGKLSVDNEILGMLCTLKSSKTILVSDYVSNSENISDAVLRSKNEDFIAFPRSSDNYHYQKIPTSNPTDENANDINTLADAKNYLYLISTDEFTDKQTMLNAINATNYDIVLIDLFFDEIALTSSEIQSLKTKANGGKRLIISYINIGAAENWRYYWKSGWKKGNPSWLKKKYENYGDEIWVQFWHQEWQQIIFGNNDSYIKKIIDANFDGAYLDNVEAYYFLIND